MARKSKFYLISKKRIDNALFRLMEANRIKSMLLVSSWSKFNVSKMEALSYKAGNLLIKI